MTVVALIVAAGQGARMRADRAKVLLPIGGGTILARTVGIFLDHPRVERVIVAVADEGAARAALGAVAERLVMVQGGRERHDSVRSGLDATSAEIVLIHDAARPLVEPRIIDAVIDGVISHGAAIPGLHVSETVKRVGPDGCVVATVAREDLVLAQTPQGFRRDLLMRAYAEAQRGGYRCTDDASLVERAGGRVLVVEGGARNIKITRPPDLTIAEALLRLADPHAGRGDG